jgi:hypothetical protein
MNEKENTARILREEPTLVTSFGCRFRLHSWTKWGNTLKLGSTYDVQAKHCVHCNIMRTRKVIATDYDQY